MRNQMEKQQITIMTNGEWGSTQVWIDEKEIYCEGVQIQGNKHIDLDIALVISHSKTTEGEIDNLLHPPAGLPQHLYPLPWQKGR